MESLNEQGEDFRNMGLDREISKSDEINYDYKFLGIKIFDDNSIKCKVPPICKIPVSFPKKKDIRRKIDFTIT